MTANDLKYPVLCQTTYGLSFMRDPKWLTMAFVANLCSDYYKKLIITDAEGITYRVAEVIKVGWVGWFWGFSLIFSRRAKIVLKLTPAPEQLSLQEAKDIVSRDFQKSSEWSSRNDLNELTKSVASAASFRAMIEAVCSP